MSPSHRMLLGAGFFVTLLLAAAADSSADSAASPYLLPLHREVIPVVKHNRTVSQKTAYYGTVFVGGPKAQTFSVVFDTGSGHVVLPSVDCESPSCLRHKQYDFLESTTAVPINADSTVVPPDEPCDQVTIGFGTGVITGELVRESVCLGPPGSAGNNSNQSSLPGSQNNVPCSTVGVVVAVEMSDSPFLSFAFDGIFGLGLKSLSLNPEFSFLDMFAGASSGPHVPHFGVFLAEDGEGSELAVGGHNAARVVGPLSWVPIAQPKLGFWQVQISAVRIGGKVLDACSNGDCRAILDTGTSHLGVPARHLKRFSEDLTAPAGSDAAASDCRLATAPTVDIDIGNVTLTLHPEDYMRRDPLEVQGRGRLGGGSAGAGNVCKPRLMPVDLKAPMAANTFILGEPVLLRYYTVYDWRTPSVGFGLAKKHEKPSHVKAPPLGDDAGVVAPTEPKPSEVAAPADTDDPNKEIFLLQMNVSGTVE